MQPAAAAVNVRKIRALIAHHKRWDLTFAIIGVLSLMVGVLTFAALFVDRARPNRRAYFPHG